MSALNSHQALAVNYPMRQAVANIFWAWYDLHLNDVVLRKRIVLFDILIRVKDLHGLFVQLVGNREEA